jgi:hypothetical protein
VTLGAFQTAFAGGGTAFGPYDAFMLRLSPSGSSLRYSSYLGGAQGHDFAYGVALTACGDVAIGGLTRAPDFPFSSGGYAAQDDAFVVRADLLPTGASRFGLPTPGCQGPLVISVTSRPSIGNSAFAITCSGAPPLAPGVLAISDTPLANPLTPGALTIWVDITSPGLFLFPAISSNAGDALFPFPVPSVPALANATFHGQCAWLDPCATGGVSASCALTITFH